MPISPLEASSMNTHYYIIYPSQIKEEFNSIYCQYIWGVHISKKHVRY